MEGNSSNSSSTITITTTTAPTTQNIWNGFDFAQTLAQQISASASSALTSMQTFATNLVKTLANEPSDEEIARKMQEEEKLEVARRREEEEALSQQLIRQLMENGEISAPGNMRQAGARVRGRAADGGVTPREPSSSTGTGDSSGSSNRNRHEGNEEVNNSNSAAGLLRLLDTYQGGNEENRRRIRELLIALQYMQEERRAGNYESLLANLQDVKTPASNKEDMPVYSWEAKEEKRESCSICLNDYEEGNEIKLLPCFHRFHKDCIDPWLDAHNTCPVCKYKIDY